MPPKITNRFALFSVDENEEPKPVKKPPEKDNPFVNQVADKDTPWQEVRRNGSSIPKPLKTLTIRDTNRKPPLPVNNTLATQTRQVSATSQSSPEHDRPVTSRENWCGICSRYFSSKSQIQAHVKSMPGHERYCNLCRRVFVDRNGLQNHIDNAAGHSIFCNLCLSAFLNEFGLRNHFENNNAVGHRYACLICLLGFKTKAELEHHLLTGQKHVWCTTCHRRFRNQEDRDAHWAITNKHKHCLQPACDFDAPNAAALEKHIEEDHFRCEGCKRIFSTKGRLINHYSACEYDVPCPNKCGTLCAGQPELARHLAACFHCAECGYDAMGESSHQLHIVSHTNNIDTISSTKTSGPIMPTKTSDALSCWACKSAHFHTPVELVQHLETCSKLPTKLLLTVLGKWWYSPLYMDLDVHAQIRRNEIHLDTMVSWLQEGVLHPFVCRADSCGRVTFGKLSDLVAHVREDNCGWDVDMLKLEGLKLEFDRACKEMKGST
ncbi:hypothetical protein DM02DRAFT_659914 [Periconia macrospinosa]|uniref:C2H2-type domain-containing protein n=1 Tax=Periconia macrospinosa TaxID=97972 RepID=A0A2V1DDL9_9PLEO|nr:hypothetical protein DM02DRAFT_659914 [Periconia macrospinosa]